MFSIFLGFMLGWFGAVGFLAAKDTNGKIYIGVAIVLLYVALNLVAFLVGQ